MRSIISERGTQIRDHCQTILYYLLITLDCPPLLQNPVSCPLCDLFMWFVSLSNNILFRSEPSRIVGMDPHVPIKISRLGEAQ